MQYCEKKTLRNVNIYIYVYIFDNTDNTNALIYHIYNFFYK